MRGANNAGVVKQRAAQLRSRDVTLDQGRVDRERGIAARRHQYIQIANIHRREGLDPVQDAPVPAIVVVQDRKARRNRMYARMAFAASILLGGGLFAAAMTNAAFGLAFGIFFLAMIAGGITAGVIISANGDPERPEAERRLRTFNASAWIAIMISLFLVMWLRFATNVTDLNHMAIPLTILELALFVLGGSCEGIAQIYAWSRDLTEADDADRLALTAIVHEMVNVKAELKSLAWDEAVMQLEREQQLGAQRERHNGESADNDSDDDVTSDAGPARKKS